MNREAYIAKYGRQFYEDERWMIQHTMRNISFSDQGIAIPPDRVIDNGLSATDSTLQLGGPLTGHTGIEVGAYSFFLPRTSDYFTFVGVDYSSATAPEFQVYMYNESNDDQAQITVDPAQFEFLARGANAADYVLLEFTKTGWLIELTTPPTRNRSPATSPPARAAALSA